MKMVDNETMFKCLKCKGYGHWYAARDVNGKLFAPSVSMMVALPGERVTCPVCKGTGILDWVQNARGEVALDRG